MPSPRRQFHRNMTLPTKGEVFVFGSNRSGYHGKGAAEIAQRLYGAQAGVGEGRTGSAYAIPTKGFHLYHYLTVDEIRDGVDRFCQYTHDHPEVSFFVTAVGCGYARHAHRDIAPLFGDALNCSFPLAWKGIL